MDFNSSDSYPTMAAAAVFDSIIHQIQASNLNFKLQLSPFAAEISIKKTPVKNRAGIPFPLKNHVNEVDDLIAKNSKLEEELVSIKKKYANAVVDDPKNSRDMLKLREEIENLVKENKELQRTNEIIENELRDLEATIKVKNHDVESLERDLSELRNKFKEEKNEIIKSVKEEAKEELARKNDELREAIKEKDKFEEKVNSLLDVLYGCPECGLYECECQDSPDGDYFVCTPLQENVSSTLPPATLPSMTSTAPLLPQLSEDPSLWTPPPTPPCITCGGINYGPSPKSMCFACIPPPRITSPHSSPGRSSSPSRTPPGTPPLLRWGTASNIKNNKDRRNMHNTNI